jgi:hypothetical protein
MAARVRLQAAVNHGPFCTDLSGSQPASREDPEKGPRVLLTSLILQAMQLERVL